MNSDGEIDDVTVRRVEQLFRDHGVQVLGYLARRAPAEDAADLMGEVLEVIWRRRRELPPVGEDKLWMYGIARHLLQNFGRIQRRHQDRTRQLAQWVRAAQPTSFARAECDLHIALEGLDPLDREILMLTYWEGFSTADAATVLSMRASTVRSRLRRAKIKLSEILRSSAEADQHTLSR